MLDSVLVASDISNRSDPALRRAGQVAGHAGARLAVMHVVEDTLPHDMTEDASRRASLYLEGQVAALGQVREPEIVIGRGQAFHVITEEAGAGAEAIAGVVAQANRDLLVLGTRGLSGAKRMFLGSVAQELMDSLEIDILAVPPTAPSP